MILFIFSVSGESYNQAVDIWALGVLFFEFLAGYYLLLSLTPTFERTYVLHLQKNTKK